MGQAGSHPGAAVPQRAGRAHTLPHEPPRLAPKVLPSLTESPRLRSTDNGAILHSGGTISGRRPTHHDVARTPNGHVHSNVYRSRSAGGGEAGELRARERDPLHRSHTNLDLRHNDNSSSINKRFGSEPDLRIEEEQKRTNNKHFRKKYRAPPPPHNDQIDGSSPDSSEGNTRNEPNRKLRLFKTRNETKKLNGNDKLLYRHSYEPKSLDMPDQTFERRYRSPCKDKETHFKYPDTRDMVQSSASLKREERLLQNRREHKTTRTDRGSGCRAKTTKTIDHSEAWKTPLLNRNFRYSDRFRKDETDLPALRREKTFDDSLIAAERDSPARLRHPDKIKLSPLAETEKPLRKSLPSLLHKNIEEKDEFQAELKKATSRIRNELGNKINVSENKTSQAKVNVHRPNPTKVQNKVKESSPIVKKQEPVRRPARKTDVKSKIATSSNVTKSQVKSKVITSSRNKENGKTLPDRGQASGKESTPEHSPTRKKEPTPAVPQEPKRKLTAPSKQFYFGMIESKQSLPKEHFREFPGLGTPIIEEIADFRLIEQKLLGYHDEDAEFDKFNAKLKEDCKIKNLSSESALSSEGSEGELSEGSLGIAVRLRPTLPKRPTSIPKFSPAAAWRQLATLDAHLAAESEPLAVETKVLGDITAESTPRSSASADKSADSGISGDHDQRGDSSPAPADHVKSSNPTWTPQQDLGDSSSEGAPHPQHPQHPPAGASLATYSLGAQPFTLSLPRDTHDRGKQLQQGFNSLQKLKKSVSGAFGAALGSRRFDIEHEPMLPESEQNWFLTKSAPNSLSNPLLFQPSRNSDDNVIKEESLHEHDNINEEPSVWKRSPSYLSWGGHVMYLPPPAAPLPADQPLSLLPAPAPATTIHRPLRSKSSGCLEASARLARAALNSEMRERDRSASPDVARALPARVEPTNRTSNVSRGKRFTFQSTVRQLERRKLAEKLSKEADLKEQQRKTELEAMRRVEEEFQRKRAREKANIRQQLRLVSSGAASMPVNNNHTKSRDSPDGSCRESGGSRDHQRHSNASSEISARSKTNTPLRCVELSEWCRSELGPRVYRDWVGARAHPPACARMPNATAHAQHYNGGETEAFSGSPRSDNYRLEFCRGRSPRSPRTPRPPRLTPAAPPSTSGSELSLRQPIKISNNIVSTMEEVDEPAIVPTLRPSRPSRTALAAV